MTVQYADDGREYRRWFQVVLRAAMWAGHYEAWFLTVAITLTMAVILAGGPGYLSDLGIAAWAVAWSSMTADVFVHRRHPCVRCAAASPLDPQAEVDRWRPALRLHHRPWVQTGVAVVVVGWLFFVQPGYASWRDWWAWLLDAAALTALAAVWISSYRHRLLQPWCPWCHWDDGGGEEISPDVPVPSASRS